METTPEQAMQSMRTPLVLPYDVVIDIVGLVASTSLHPFADLSSIGATCKLMYAATKEPEVLRLVALDQMKTMKLCNNILYIAILNNLADAGNPEACFLSGLMHVFMNKDRQSGLTLLEQASAAGQKTATYVLGIVLYSAGETCDAAKRYINQVEADSEIKMTNQECQQCQWRTILLLNVAKIAGATKKVLLKPYGSHCASEGCGRIVWRDYYNVFCRDDCRITHEYNMFLKYFSAILY